MSIAEQYEILYVLLDALDRHFSSWMSASFACVVAAHFMGSRLNGFLASLISIAYSLFSATMVVRFLTNGAKFAEIRDDLIAAGEYYAIEFAEFGSLLILLTFIVGFFGTNGYVWYCYKNRAR